ncbi:hypothetical protein [Streptomyces apricus]|nr:hypothetical protein [Streptomyces apricus]
MTGAPEAIGHHVHHVHYVHHRGGGPLNRARTAVGSTVPYGWNVPHG